MASTKEIKRRIKSVKNTKKITKAMELVAASKMKRAVSRALASRVYSSYSWEVLSALREQIEEVNHPLFVPRENKESRKKILLLVITSNRGLCGAYNAQVLKKAIAHLKSAESFFDIITVGRKGESVMKRMGQNIVASFTSLPDGLTSRDAMPVAEIIIDAYTRGQYDEVVALYTDFVSPLIQKPNLKQVLPVSKTSLKDFIEEVGESTKVERAKEASGNKKNQYLLEGDKNELAGSLARKIIRMQIYQMILESNASEQSARMIAMKNASEASGEMIDDLTLVFNKARQASITQEISEISAGMASVS
jgi:F-type H+-transporting ATPase subunit gamma